MKKKIEVSRIFQLLNTYDWPPNEFNGLSILPSPLATKTNKEII